MTPAQSTTERGRGAKGHHSAHSRALPCSVSLYLHRLGISPHQALPIALPDEVHLPPCPRLGDAQLHLKPARLPPGREQAATSAHRGTFS